MNLARRRQGDTANQTQIKLRQLFLGLALAGLLLICSLARPSRASIDIAHKKKNENHWSLTIVDLQDESGAKLQRQRHKATTTTTTTTTTKAGYSTFASGPTTLGAPVNSTLPTTPFAVSASDGSKPRSRNQHFGELASLRNKCALAERELDRCSAQLIGLGQTIDAYPDSMQELNSVYCPRFRQTVACVRNNTDCYRPFERQIINWILSSTRRMNYKRCKNENEKQRFLKLTNSCFATMRSPMDDCMATYIASLDGVAEYNRDLERLSENDIQIQLSCCANRRFKQCVMRSAKQRCQSHESLEKLRRTNSVSSHRAARKQLFRAVQDTMEDLKSTLDEMALTGPDFVCTGVDEHFCRTRFDGRYTRRAARHKSIVPAMIKIYANK